MGWTNLNYTIDDLRGKRVDRDTLNNEIMQNIAWLRHRDRILVHSDTGITGGSTNTIFDGYPVYSDGGFLLFDITVQVNSQFNNATLTLELTKDGDAVADLKHNTMYGTERYINLRMFWIDEVEDYPQSHIYGLTLNNNLSTAFSIQVARMMVENIGRASNA